MKKVIGPILFLMIAVTAFAQKHERRLVQFTGIVHNADSTNVAVPYVTIVNQSDKEGTAQTNYKGYYSFVVHERDTIRFTCVGYNELTVVIPADVPTQSYTIQLKLKPEIPNLPVFKEFPWATTEEFTKEFLTMKIADDDLA